MEQTSHGSQTIKTFVHQVEAIQKESLMGYSGGKKRTFLKIFVALPKLVPTARSILESGFNYGTGEKTYTTFESNIPFVLRCMIDIHLNGGSWIEIPTGKWSYSKERTSTGKSEAKASSSHKSTCQIEVDASFESLICHPPEGEWGKLAPFRILSFGILY
jgi:DNA polymerase delta subunit 1